MNKVILLQPPSFCRTFTRSGSVYPPLGLCQLAAVDRNNLMTVLDAEGLGLTEEETIKALHRYKPKIIGLTATSFTLEIVEQWAKVGKDLGAKIIVGGPHASLGTLDLFEKCPNVDYVVRGEGEVIINELIEIILEEKHDKLKNLNGVCFRDGDKIHISSEILKVKSFDNLPFPKLDKLPIQNYWCPDAVKLPMVTMMTTRGCPHKCAFCSSPTVMGKRLRGWSVKQIIRELEYLYFELGVREISFVDDVFTINKKRTARLCQAIIQSPIEISWFCNARADQVDENLAELMREAGCHQAYLGFESGDQRILNNINKGTTVEKLKKGAKILKEKGIHRSIGFVLGLPGEDNASVDKSIRLAQEIRPERLQFTRFTPLVGSPLADFKMNEYGFHNKGTDKVGDWIKMAYAACNHIDWGKESW